MAKGMTKNSDFSVELRKPYTEILLDNNDYLKIKAMNIINEDSFKRKHQLYFKNEADVDWVLYRRES